MTQYVVLLLPFVSRSVGMLESCDDVEEALEKKKEAISEKESIAEAKLFGYRMDALDGAES